MRSSTRDSLPVTVSGFPVLRLSVGVGCWLSATSVIVVTIFGVAALGLCPSGWSSFALVGLTVERTRARCGTREGYSAGSPTAATHRMVRAVLSAFVTLDGATVRCGWSEMDFYDRVMRQLDPEARRVALALLARGIIRPHEAAELAGVSLQVVRYWIRRKGVDWERIRRRRLAHAWRKELRNGPRLVETETAQAGNSRARL